MLLRASPWLAILLLLGIVSVQSSTIHKWHEQANKLSLRLEAISTTKDTQKVITRDNIVTVTKTTHDADGRAKVIEQAPLPGNCQTPKEVLSADI